VTSPFAPVLAGHADLPWAFREQFLLAQGGRLRLQGTMRRVWRRHRWTWPLFALLARMDILFPETGENVPATLTIHAEANRHCWRRTFAFPRRRAFDADMCWSAELGAVVERLGPADLIEMVWQVSFRPPSTIEIASLRGALRLGRWRIQLPGWLAAQARAVEVADPERDDAIAIDLTVSHPFLGPIFGYAGDFRLRRLDD